MATGRRSASPGHDPACRRKVDPRRTRNGWSQIRFFAARNRLRLTSPGRGNGNAHGSAHTQPRRPAAAGHRAPALPRGQRPLHRRRGPRASAPRRRARLRRRRPRRRGPRPQARRRSRGRAGRERRGGRPPRGAAASAACSTTPCAPYTPRAGIPLRKHSTRCAAPPTPSRNNSGAGRDRSHHRVRPRDRRHGRLHHPRPDVGRQSPTHDG